MYSNLETSIPIASMKSVETAFSVSIRTANPPFFCVSASRCAESKLFPEPSSPVTSTILPTGAPPCARFETAISNISEPNETQLFTLVGVSESSKKYATF